jgi:hypothetical protein
VNPVVVVIRGRNPLSSDWLWQSAHADEARNQKEAEPHLFFSVATMRMDECYQ